MSSGSPSPADRSFEPAIQGCAVTHEWPTGNVAPQVIHNVLRQARGSVGLGAIMNTRIVSVATPYLLILTKPYAEFAELEGIAGLLPTLLSHSYKV